MRDPEHWTLGPQSRACFEWSGIDGIEAESIDQLQYLGSPETVATKIAAVIRQLGLSRFDWAYATGRVPHEQRMATIELYGREVVPRVRELLAEPVVEPATAELSAAAVTTGSNVQQ